MMVLRAPTTERVLTQIRAAGAENDAAAKARFRGQREQRGSRLPAEEAAAVFRDAALAVAPAVGELLYALALGRRARTVVGSARRSGPRPSTSPRP